MPASSPRPARAQPDALHGPDRGRPLPDGAYILTAVAIDRAALLGASATRFRVGSELELAHVGAAWGEGGPARSRSRVPRRSAARRCRRSAPSGTRTARWALRPRSSRRPRRALRAPRLLERGESRVAGAGASRRAALPDQVRSSFASPRTSRAAWPDVVHRVRRAAARRAWRRGPGVATSWRDRQDPSSPVGGSIAPAPPRPGRSRSPRGARRPRCPDGPRARGELEQRRVQLVGMVGGRQPRTIAAALRPSPAAGGISERIWKVTPSAGRRRSKARAHRFVSP